MVGDFIDLRSDTVTLPTPEMRRAMAEAPVGDDVYGDDPTVEKLEKLAAEILDKEAALFVPSGTFGNQLSLLTHTTSGDEVIVPARAHVLMHEVGAAAFISRVQLRPLEDPGGKMDPDEIRRTIRGDDIHFPRTSLIWLENAHSLGWAVPLEHIKEVKQIAREHDLKVHMDGARIFNAAIALGVEACELAKYADSVMFCLSKGLCAPVGSMVVGDEMFIKRARKNRKLLGGAMRQVGVLAAAGIIALTRMVDRLVEDHEKARYLAEKLRTFQEIEVAWDRLDINMVFFRFRKVVDHETFVKYMFQNGVKINPPDDGEYRLVTHYWVEKGEIDRFVCILEKFLLEVR